MEQEESVLQSSRMSGHPDYGRLDSSKAEILEVNTPSIYSTNEKKKVLSKENESD